MAELADAHDSKSNKNMSMWRNWYTHRSQKPAGNHVGSIPTIDTNDVSVRTF